MDVLLLTDIKGIGRKNDLIDVSQGFALNHLLPHRKAIVATPNVRKQYAAEIKARAEARMKERELQSSLSAALSNKTLHIAAKASASGKLYAAVSADVISERLKTEYGFEIPASSVLLDEHIKSTGKHPLKIEIGTQNVSITVDVVAEKEKEKAAA